jgi:hypothetical protein
VFNHDVAALDVTEVPQSLTKGLVHVGANGQIGGQVAYSRDFGRLLRLDSERRGEEAASKSSHKCPPVHHSIT